MYSSRSNGKDADWPKLSTDDLGTFGGWSNFSKLLLSFWCGSGLSEISLIFFLSWRNSRRLVPWRNIGRLGWFYVSRRWNNQRAGKVFLVKRKRVIAGLWLEGFYSCSACRERR